MSRGFDPERQIEKILHSPAYRLAYQDGDFLAGPRLRAMRMQLEMAKPEFSFLDHDIRSTIVVFGSARLAEPSKARSDLERAKARLADTPDDVRRQRAVARAERLLATSRYYDVAREFGNLISKQGQQGDGNYYVICTGGGPGVMEAANRGANEADAISIGLNIHLPMEQSPNPYITPDLCFQFRYFAIRKMHFLLRAKALVAFPGGFGTFDELFEVLTLRQTGRMQDIPIILFGREFWDRAVNFQFLADEGVIHDEDLDLFRYAETAEEAWTMIRKFHQRYATDGQEREY